MFIIYFITIRQIKKKKIMKFTLFLLRRSSAHRSFPTWMKTLRITSIVYHVNDIVIYNILNIKYLQYILYINHMYGPGLYTAYSASVFRQIIIALVHIGAQQLYTTDVIRGVRNAEE